MQTLTIIYRVSALAPQNDNTAPRAAIVVAMGLPDAKRIIADDVGQAAHHITIISHSMINHGECMQVTAADIAALTQRPAPRRHAIID